MEDNIYKTEYVRDLFDKMSGSYERMNYITSFGFSIRWRNQAVKLLPKSQENIQVIDLLTGMGETWDSLRNRFPSATITALDFSTEMLKHAHQKNAKRFQNQIVIKQEDILNSHLPSNHYDVVTCAYGLKTFSGEQLELLAQETKRILKEGGSFSFVEVSKPSNKFLNALYGFYLNSIIPILGRLFLGNPVEYRMLWEYISQFKNTQKAVEIFEKAGLKTQYTSFFYGCATGMMGYK